MTKEPTEEERKANVEKLLKLSKELKLKRICEPSKSKLVWKQYHDPEELLKALATFAVREDD